MAPSSCWQHEACKQRASEIIAKTGAPRGSIYHHFPRGKGQLVEEAIERVADRTLSDCLLTLGER